MRVLLVHNFYQSSAPSGENGVYLQERDLLQRGGIAVSTFERRNDSIDAGSLTATARVAWHASWSRETYRALSVQLRKERPQIAHFHNTFPLISPSAYAACRDSAVPVVQTLHNYRLICPGGLLMRKGQPCEDCVGSHLLPALAHRCYRDSAAGTAAVVWMLLRNKRHGTYASLVDRYIALTSFAASRLISGGLPADRIDVKPNFLADAPAVGTGRGGYALYVGRLTAEKGVRVLLQAWRTRRDLLPLKIVGDGALRNELEQFARTEVLPVEFLGMRTRAQVLELVRDAALQIIPSQWYEGFPLVLVEALACGTPLVASRIGSLDELVADGRTGVKFEPGDAAGLAAAVRRLCAEPIALDRMRLSARAEFESRYGAAENLDQLLAIYDRAASDCRSASRRRLVNE
ncbi:MAG: glycosyltransferase [Gammaproteobacteria bacterium]